MPVPAVAFRMARPTSVEPVKAILSTSACGDQRRAGRAVAGDDVDDARRQARLDADLRKGQRGQRGVFGRLQHDRIAGGERRRDLPGEHQEREVPRNDLSADADRPRAWKFALDQRGPAGVMIEMSRDKRDVDVARLADRLAVVDRLEDREKALALLNVPGQRIEMLRPLVAGERGPFRLRPAGGGDRRVDVGRRALRHARDALAGRGVEHIEERAGLREPAVDQEAEAALVAIEPGRRMLAAFGRRAIVHRAQNVLDQGHRSLTPSRGDTPRNSGRSHNGRAAARCR